MKKRILSLLLIVLCVLCAAHAAGAAGVGSYPMFDTNFNVYAVKNKPDY